MYMIKRIVRFKVLPFKVEYIYSNHCIGYFACLKDLCPYIEPLLKE